MYQLIAPYLGAPSNCVKKIDGNLFIPLDDANADYQTYLKWLDGYEVVNGQMTKTSEGNTPLPADEPAQG